MLLFAQYAKVPVSDVPLSLIHQACQLLRVGPSTTQQSNVTVRSSFDTSSESALLAVSTNTAAMFPTNLAQSEHIMSVIHTNTRSLHRAPALMIAFSFIEPRFPHVIALPSSWATCRCRLCRVLGQKKRHFTQCRMSSSTRAFRIVDNGGLVHRHRRFCKHTRPHRSHSRTRGRIYTCKNVISIVYSYIWFCGPQLTTCGCTHQYVRSCSDISHIFSNPQFQPLK